MNHRNDASAPDREDPFAPLREQFALTPEAIYRDGNSLGVTPKVAAAGAASGDRKGIRRRGV